MTNDEEKFLLAALDEDGLPVSAGGPPLRSLPQSVLRHERPNSTDPQQHKVYEKLMDYLKEQVKALSDEEWASLCEARAGHSPR